MIEALKAVFTKELIDSLRDRRSLMSALILPLSGPLLFGVMFNFLAKKNSNDKPLEVSIIGRANAPQLVAFLEENEAVVIDAPDDPDSAIKSGKVHVVLVIESDYREAYLAGRPARVELIIDDSNDDARTSVRRLQRLLRQYGQRLGVLRLIAHGVAPDLATPIMVDEVDLATPKRQAARLLSMISMFAFLAAFVGGASVAIDATAGERERGSLEPLLINPVPRSSLALGKWGVTALFNIVIAGLTLFFYKIVLSRVPLSDLGVTVQLGVSDLMTMFALVIPVALFAAAVLLTVSMYARSFKEAQTYLSVLVFVPMLPSVVLMVNPLKAKLWMMMIPAFGQNLLVNDVLRGEPLNPLHVLVASISALVAALLVLLILTRLFNKERIVFGR